VSMGNSGPVGAETSIRVRLPEAMGINDAGKALAGLAIGVAA
jgi:hypothetical protein